jgi:enoyl-CoA hydratase/carnithine racemase
MMAHALLAAGADPDVHVSVLYGSCKAFAKGKAEAFAVAMGW